MKKRKVEGREKEGIKKRQENKKRRNNKKTK